MKMILFSVVGVAAISAGSSKRQTHVRVPELEIQMSELEQVISEQTMEVHMTLFERYAKQFNTALQVLTEEGSSQKKLLTQGGILNVLMNLEEIKNSDLQTALRYYGGGYINHYLFFKTLVGTSLQSSKTKTASKPKGELMVAIKENFGSFQEFEKIFEEAQMTVLGSGWAWLVVEKVGNKKVKLAVVTTQNQDNPIMFESTATGGSRNTKNELIIPILGNDLFEHAYLFNTLDLNNQKVVQTPHQAKVQYVKNFLSVVNWAAVEELFEQIVEQHGHQGMENFINQQISTSAQEQEEEEEMEEQEQESTNRVMKNSVRGSGSSGNIKRQMMNKRAFKKLGSNPEQLYIFS